MKVIAVIPALNEQGKIGVTVGKTKPGVDFTVVVDDGSTDETSQEAAQAGAHVLRHEANKGVGAAIRTGIEYALGEGYDVCVVLGGDDQDDPSEIPLLLDAIKQGFDFVQGSRRIHGRRTINMPLFRRITTKCYSLFFTLLVGNKITDGTNGFRAFRLSIFQNKKINIWQRWLNTYELEPYLYYQCTKQGLKVTEVPVTKAYPTDDRGYTKMIPFRDWWRITKPLILLRLGLRK